MSTATVETTKSWGGGKSPFNVEYGKLMMWYFLMSDAFTFGAFLISYGTIRFSTNGWPDPNEVFRSFPFAPEGVHAPLVFVSLQWDGFKDLELRGFALIGPQSNSASSFLFIITGLHMLHVLGGVVALCVLFFRAIFIKSSETNIVPVQIVATYWHFVDILWIYLFIFYNLIA